MRRVSGLVEGGGTRLYDATLWLIEEILAKGDPKHIRAVLVLSDGEDTESISDLGQVMEALGANVEEGGNAIKLFTIAFGERRK